MSKRVKCSIDSELHIYFSKMKLEKYIEERENLYEDLEELEEDLFRKERDLERDVKEYHGFYRSYKKFLTTCLQPPTMSSLPDFSPFKMAFKTTNIPQQHYEEFQRECETRNEIMDQYRSDFMRQIIDVDLAHIALNDAKSRLSEVKIEINILSNSF